MVPLKEIFFSTHTRGEPELTRQVSLFKSVPLIFTLSLHSGAESPGLQNVNKALIILPFYFGIQISSIFAKVPSRRYNFHSPKHESLQRVALNPYSTENCVCVGHQTQMKLTQTT